MFAHRRKVLKGLGAGLVGLAGLVAPQKLFAWGRRRGGCYSGPYYPVPAGCYPGDPLSLPGQGRIIALDDKPVSPITISYPSGAATITVFGNGGFFVWGTFDTTQCTRVTNAVANWGAGNQTQNPLTAAMPSPCKWAFMFHDVPPGSSVTLTVNGVNGAQAVQPATIFFTIGGF